ncbi:MAG: ABC transporter permease subunit [Litorilinea sp.]
MSRRVSRPVRMTRRVLVGALIGGAVLLPLLPLLIWPFAHGWFFPDLLPQTWTLRTWRYLISPSARIGEALFNSLAIAASVVSLAALVGLPAARVLARAHLRGKSLIEWLFLAPLIVPGLVVAMGIHILFIRYGLADTHIGVILVHLIPALPYFVLIMGSVFANYSIELEETARTLGAGALRVFWHITLPAIAPGLTVAALFTFLVSWSQYITTVLIGGGKVITLPMLLFPFISAANHPQAAAVSLIFLAPAFVVLAFTARVLAGRPAVLGGLGRI